MAGLSTFSVDDLEHFSRVLRTIGDGAADMPETAGRVTDFLFDNLRCSDGRRSCVNVLLHNSRPFRHLPPPLQALAREADSAVTDDTTCLAQIAVAGYEPDQRRAGSVVLPLTDGVFRTQLALRTMLDAMGIDKMFLTDPRTAAASGLHHDELRPFLVRGLARAPWVSDDARPILGGLGVQSMLGLGGGLPTGDLFLLSLLTVESIPARTVELVRSLSPAVKATLIPFALRPWGNT